MMEMMGRKSFSESRITSHEQKVGDVVKDFNDCQAKHDPKKQGSREVGVLRYLTLLFRLLCPPPRKPYRPHDDDPTEVYHARRKAKDNIGMSHNYERIGWHCASCCVVG